MCPSNSDISAQIQCEGSIQIAQMPANSGLLCLLSLIDNFNLDWFVSNKCQNYCCNISRLKQLSFTWFSINHFLEKSVRLKSDHQDLLRSICFQKLYFHCSSAEEWSSQASKTSHIFWGAFISSYFCSFNRRIKLCCFFSSMFSLYQTISLIISNMMLNKKSVQKIYFIFCLKLQ